MQDYLEAIFALIGEKGAARVRDIAIRLGVRRSAVSNALHCLAEHGLINYKPYQLVSLTDGGREIGAEVRRRHAALQRFFMVVLGVDSETADENACRIEHHIDEAVLRRLACLTDLVAKRPRGSGADWLSEYAGDSRVDQSAEADRGEAGNSRQEQDIERISKGGRDGDRDWQVGRRDG